MSEAKEKLQEDIKKVEDAIAALKADGEDLFSEEIANLTKKLENAKAELAADVSEGMQQAEDKAKSFWQALDPWQRVGNTILLVWILLRLLGAI